MRPSLLLVDDHDNFRRTLAIALRLEGLDVKEADDAHVARAALSTLRFDAVVVQLLVPGDALGLLEEVKRRLPSCRRIACSQHPEALVAARPRLEGAYELEVPFSPATLLALTGLSPHSPK